jgi:hypothetical protein
MQTLQAMQVVKGAIGENNDFFRFSVRVDDFEVEEQFPLNDDVKKTAQRLRLLAHMLEQGPQANFIF